MDQWEAFISAGRGKGGEEKKRWWRSGMKVAVVVVLI